jgi:hypothetical protein
MTEVPGIDPNKEAFEKYWASLSPGERTVIIALSKVTAGDATGKDVVLKQAESLQVSKDALEADLEKLIQEGVAIREWQKREITDTGLKTTILSDAEAAQLSQEQKVSQKVKEYLKFSEAHSHLGSDYKKYINITLGSPTASALQEAEQIKRLAEDITNTRNARSAEEKDDQTDQEKTQE